MTQQDILTEIRSLKTDLNTYADQMVRLRYDDLKNAFIEQMKAAVGEEGRKTFRTQASGLRDSSSCPHKAVCLAKLEEAVETAAARFKANDFAEAERTLDEVEALIAGDCAPCQDGDCSDQAAETLRRVRAVLKVYEGLAMKLEKDGALAAAGQRPDAPAPQDYEAVLDPLANAWRVRTMQTLRGGELGLTELGRALDLKTGHLQFHLKALISARYVEQDRRRHRYRLTDRGSMALDYAEDMVAKLRPAAMTRSDFGTGDMEVMSDAR